MGAQCGVVLRDVCALTFLFSIELSDHGNTTANQSKVCFLC